MTRRQPRQGRDDPVAGPGYERRRSRLPEDKVTTIVLVGTLDTKGAEYGYLRERVRQLGAQTILIDVGTGGPPTIPADITAAEVAAAAGQRLEDLAERGQAVTAMGLGAVAICGRLLDERRLDGVIALGGSGGTYIATRVMRALPAGLPKVMVSTMTSGDIGPYVGGSDISMTYSIVDIAGLNPILARIIANAAASVVAAARVRMPAQPARPTVAASMFGVTTPCVSRARARLRALLRRARVPRQRHRRALAGGYGSERVAGRGPRPDHDRACR